MPDAGNVEVLRAYFRDESHRSLPAQCEPTARVSRVYAPAEEEAWECPRVCAEVQVEVGQHHALRRTTV